MLKDLDITPEDPAELRAVNRLLADEVKALSLKVEQLQHQLHGANRHRFGSKSEGLDQLNLDLLEDAEIVEAAEDQAKQPAPSRRELIQSRSANTAASSCRIIWIGKTRSSLPVMNAVVVVATCAPWVRCHRRVGIRAGTLQGEADHPAPQSLFMVRGDCASAAAIAPH
ncbi:transposase [Roseibium sp. TrichSKD4]|uniref:IS66 family transposase n=1 Tax=Roseibium sp. TrichSKD4 TaxID=744980 RepID=UPI0001E565B5|nr:transposase [Roseibium sp. TrichSKD4]EFO33346.1 transposase [Roseibium sp. TrichSKD4]